MTREEYIEFANALKNNYTIDFDKLPEFCDMAISALSENRGEWIVREDNTSFVKQIPRKWVECSHCGWSFSYDRIHDNFCSKCGARMKGGE